MGEGRRPEAGSGLLERTESQAQGEDSSATSLGWRFTWSRCCESCPEAELRAGGDQRVWRDVVRNLGHQRTEESGLGLPVKSHKTCELRTKKG